MNNSGAARAAAKFTGLDRISRNFRNVSKKFVRMLAAERKNCPSSSKLDGI
jgi:hypothetical protein